MTTSAKNEFYEKVRSDFERVLIYEDVALQEKARSLIPRDELQFKAESKMLDLGLDQKDLRDLALVELLDWFKNSFFKWVDKPRCESCRNSRTTFVGMTIPSFVEKFGDAHRVEKYECENCRETIRFPRYNNPGFLLDERCGRCGEWANCFTLCCRALDYDARFVMDWTDHVWTEVYSENQKRWLHCDPCENVCDKPLLYEAGWGKKLTYILAYSKDDIQDVTWRYSANYAEVLSRRNLVTEPWLVGLIVMLRNERQFPLSASRKRYLEERTIQELVELLTPRSCTEDELVGRQTGSLEWRMARGELGKKQARPSLKNVIVPTEKEKEKKCIELKYSCAKDLYLRGNEKIVEYVSLVFEAENIMRKVEYDWGMVYLARLETSKHSKITWKIDLSSCGMRVDSVDIEVHSACYENGIVAWELCGDDEQMVKLTSGKHQTVTELSNSKVLLLTAMLSQGSGKHAWQHTQLFRQKRFPKSGVDLEWPFSVVIHLKE